MSTHPYKITIYGKDESAEAHRWCRNNLNFKAWFTSYIATEAMTFAFQNEEDAIVFRLTWGGRSGSLPD